MAASGITHLIMLSNMLRHESEMGAPFPLQQKVVLLRA